VIGDLKRLGQPIPFVSSSLKTDIELKDVKKHRILGMGEFLINESEFIFGMAIKLITFFFFSLQVHSEKFGWSRLIMMIPRTP
jgi:hypothetical protein